jgi:hypothetical protein
MLGRRRSSARDDAQAEAGIVTVMSGRRERNVARAQRLDEVACPERCAQADSFVLPGNHGGSRAPAEPARSGHRELNADHARASAADRPPTPATSRPSRAARDRDGAPGDVGEPGKLTGPAFAGRVSRVSVTDVRMSADADSASPLRARFDLAVAEILAAAIGDVRSELDAIDAADEARVRPTLDAIAAAELPLRELLAATDGVAAR